VVSLWNVNDNATAELMSQFYGTLQQDKPASAALREAQLALWAIRLAHRIGKTALGVNGKLLFLRSESRPLRGNNSLRVTHPEGFSACQPQQLSHCNPRCACAVEDNFH
ncbi:MAG: CHAT domain-containing protein, partial [Spirulina sp. SIO3F2]|nr:CHAT domain-containing protein [Spirulina sp. SIO3F2]